MRLSFSLLILFLLLSIAVALGFWRSFDLQTTIFLQERFSRQFDVPLSLFSLLGSFEVTVVILALLLFLIFKIEKRIWWEAGILFLVLLFLEIFGKNFVNQPPLPLNFLRYTLPIGFPSFGVETASSFPSGHTARTVFITILILGWLWRKNLASRLKVSFLLLAIVLNLLMFFSRVYLGEHWVTDVAGGILLAAGLGALSLSSSQLRKRVI